MRIAALLSGWPRFCADFDSQLEQLSQYNVDWYCGFWNPGGHDQDNRVSPGWQPIDAQAAAERIQQNLPPQHRIALLELIDPAQCPPPQNEYQGFYCNALGVHRQYSILQQVDLRRQQAQVDYDLVIRTRPDLGLEGSLDLAEAANILTQDPTLLLMPTNERRGAHLFSDLWCAALPNTMQVYTQVVQHLDSAHRDRGVPYNPEYLLGHILSTQGLKWPTIQNFQTIRARQGRHVPGRFFPVWGRWI